MGPEAERSLAFAFAPFPFSLGSLRNGPQRSRARGFCAAEENLLWVGKDSPERTLDGEDRSGTWG